MTPPSTSASEVFARIQAGQPVRIIDVRTPVEFAQLHVLGAHSVPLDHLDPRAVMAAGDGNANEDVFVICKSGGRAAKACERFRAAGFTNVQSIEGGTEAWEQAGHPVVHGHSRVISLERQVRIGAGIFVLTGAILGFAVHPAFFGICAFMGAGLIFAGVTGFCGMGMILARCPWNQNVSKACVALEVPAAPKSITSSM